MSDKSNDDGTGSRDQSVQPYTDDSRVQESSTEVAALIALEDKRLESQNLRMEVTAQAIAAGDAADQRQYEYSLARLNLNAENRDKQRRILSQVLWAGIIIPFVFGGITLGMAFWGTEAQSETASRFLDTIVKAIGGIGFYLVGRAIYRYTTRDTQGN